MDQTELNLIDDELAAVMALVSSARRWPPIPGVDPAEFELHLVRLSEAVVFIEAIIFKGEGYDDSPATH